MKCFNLFLANVPILYLPFGEYKIGTFARNGLKRKAEEKSAHLEILKKRKEELISEINKFP